MIHKPNIPGSYAVLLFTASDCSSFSILSFCLLIWEWKRSVFIPISKKGNAKECSNYHIIAVISHASKVTLKFSKPGFNSPWTMNFQMFMLDLEKGEEPEIKLPTCAGSSKKEESSRKTSALLTMPKLLTVWITTNWKILKEIGIPDHLTYLLRNLYAGQEATVRTGHGTTDWVQIWKAVLFKYINIQRLYFVTLLI